MAEAEPEARRLSALAAGDRHAADELVDRTYPVVFRVLCQMCHGDASLAADLTQETFRRAWAALGQFEGRSSFATWLCRIAYNTFADHARRRRELPLDPDSGVAARADETDDPSEQLIERETMTRLRRAVLALPDELRFTVVARFWGEAEVRDIARVEHISQVAVRKRLRRALRLLAGCVQEERS